MRESGVLGLRLSYDRRVSVDWMCDQAMRRLRLGPPTDAKRFRNDDTLRKFDPVDDPIGALQSFNATVVAAASLESAEERDAAKRMLDSSEPLLLEFLQDQAAICTLFGDVETTRLIEHGTPIATMQISVTTLLFEEANGFALMTLSFWGDGSLGRGAPLHFLRHALEHAKRIVFYNADFDLTVIGAGDAAAVNRWRARTFDPYMELRAVYPTASGVSLKLDSLLSANDLDPKEASGAEAVEMFTCGHLDDLEAYNRRDVQALRELVRLDRIRLDDVRSTCVVAIKYGFPTFAGGSPMRLVQNKPEWYEFRQRKIGSSQAAAFLRLSYQTTRDEAFEQLLDHAEAPKETEAMRRGREMEAEVARRYAARTGAALKEVGVFPRPIHGEWLFASPDRLVRTAEMAPGKFALLECKSVAKLTAPPPAHWVIQVQLQLACSKAPYCDITQLDSDGTLLIHRVRQDSGLAKAVVSALEPVYASAKRVFDGVRTAEDTFADDLVEFTRMEQLELKERVAESIRLFSTLRPSFGQM